jgi:hypothetical protein
MLVDERSLNIYFNAVAIVEARYDAQTEILYRQPNGGKYPISVVGKKYPCQDEYIAIYSRPLEN